MLARCDESSHPVRQPTCLTAIRPTPSTLLGVFRHNTRSPVFLAHVCVAKDVIDRKRPSFSRFPPQSSSNLRAEMHLPHAA
jgi:hypothetical protein